MLHSLLYINVRVFLEYSNCDLPNFNRLQCRNIDIFKINEVLKCLKEIVIFILSVVFYEQRHCYCLYWHNYILNNKTILKYPLTIKLCFIIFNCPPVILHFGTTSYLKSNDIYNTCFLIFFALLCIQTGRVSQRTRIAQVSATAMFIIRVTSNVW